MNRVVYATRPKLRRPLTNKLIHWIYVRIVLVKKWTTRALNHLFFSLICSFCIASFSRPSPHSDFDDEFPDARRRFDQILVEIHDKAFPVVEIFDGGFLDGEGVDYARTLPVADLRYFDQLCVVRRKMNRLLEQPHSARGRSKVQLGGVEKHHSKKNLVRVLRMRIFGILTALVFDPEPSELSFKNK